MTPTIIHLFEDAAVEELPFPQLFDAYFLTTVTVLDEIAKSTNPTVLTVHSTPGAERPNNPRDFMFYLCEQAATERAKALTNLKVFIERA